MQSSSEWVSVRLERIQYLYLGGYRARNDMSGVRVRVMCSGIASKHWQIAHAIPKIKVKLTIFVDDHVFLPREVPRN